MGSEQRIICKVVSGPNRGDAVSLKHGACRLVGRHLADDETAMMDRDGNRAIDRASVEVITAHLSDLGAATVPGAGSAGREAQTPAIDVAAFDRGPDVILADTSISRLHAMLLCDSDGPAVIDLGSANGTYLNGERIGSSVLSTGDVLRLGASELHVEVL